MAKIARQLKYSAVRGGRLTLADILGDDTDDDDGGAGVREPRPHPAAPRGHGSAALELPDAAQLPAAALSKQ